LTTNLAVPGSRRTPVGSRPRFAFRDTQRIIVFPGAALEMRQGDSRSVLLFNCQ
jgi:hypothetical protein